MIFLMILLAYILIAFIIGVNFLDFEEQLEELNSIFESESQFWKIIAMIFVIMLCPIMFVIGIIKGIIQNFI